MIEVNKKDLPEFLKESPFLANLEDSEDDLVQIPEKNYKENTNVNNIEDYKNLLFTVSYFEIPIPDEIFVFENDVRNEDEILEFLSTHRDDIFMKEVFDNFKKIMVERSQIIDFSILMSPDYSMEDLEEEDINGKYSKNPYLRGYFCFKNKIINDEIDFESSLEELMDLLEIFKNIKSTHEKKKSKNGRMTRTFFNGSLNISYGGGDLKILINLGFQDDEDETCMTNRYTSYVFRENTIIYDNFINCVEKILQGLKKFQKLSEEKKSMAAYDKNGVLFVLKNVFNPMYMIGKFITEYDEEIGKKYNEKEFEKWLIKHKRIINVGNNNLFF